MISFSSSYSEEPPDEYPLRVFLFLSFLFGLRVGEFGCVAAVFLSLLVSEPSLSGCVYSFVLETTPSYGLETAAVLLEQVPIVNCVKVFVVDLLIAVEVTFSLFSLSILTKKPQSFGRGRSEADDYSGLLWRSSFWNQKKRVLVLDLVEASGSA